MHWYRTKRDGKSNQYVFVGYEEGSNAYRLLEKKTNKIVISRDVHFIENCHNNSIYINEKENEKEKANVQKNKKENEVEFYLEDNNKNDTAEEGNNFEIENDLTYPENTEELRRSKRKTKGKLPERFEDFKLKTVKMHKKMTH
ncbi:hypothetical protein JTB14_035037 [Gonioctena quinquepunctata]|nr:hypothetical protein JTB14_035037 [Gonioctena quinquepunctata]